MKIVGQKYLQYTNEFRQIPNSMQMKRIKQIMTIPKSGTYFQKKFPQYPIQYTWKHKNMDLHAYAWQPQKQHYNKPNALLINYNALNSHTGLSGSMAQTLANSGILMTGVDYPNFGKSFSPFPGHIQSMYGLEEISEQFLLHAVQRYPNIPVFLNGMSMGGLMAFQIAKKKPTLVNGCILVNPAFRDNPINEGFLKKLVMLAGLFLPKIQIIKPIKNHSTCHSLRKYRQTDKLLYSGKIWTSTILNLLSFMRRISKQQNFQKLNIPFLCIQGGSDKLLNPFTIFELQKYSRSTDKQIVIIPNLWHALWFDDSHDEVVQMVKQWILDRVQTTTSKTYKNLSAHQNQNQLKPNKQNNSHLNREDNT